MVAKVFHSGLGVLAKTLDGYLSGVNADRHLDKVLDEYEQTQEGEQQSFYATGNKYQGNNGGYKRENNNGYKKPYNNYQNQYRN